MKREYQTFTLFSCLMFLILSACQKPEELGNCDFSEEIAAYQLVWSDEFDGETIDRSKWSFDLGNGCEISEDLCGWGNNELEYYTDREENAFIRDGNLVIRAIKELPFYQGEHAYTSARMVTKEKGDWTYGRIDVSAKLPIGRGMWPAIWMLPTDNLYGGWPKSGEIDIMENIGSEPQRTFGTIHYGHDFWRFNSSGYELESETFSDDFHLFSVLWKDDCIKFLVDGNAIENPNSRTSTLPTTWPFDQRFHLLLNVAVGGNLPGNPDASTSFPQEMEIEYVRVYQEK